MLCLYPFSFSTNSTDWFPGWLQYEYYNRQPNDDGLSDQDCVEIRRLFRYPPAKQKQPPKHTAQQPLDSMMPNRFDGEQQQSRLLSSFMWNDRDCNAKNYFICEKPMQSMEEEDNIGGGDNEGHNNDNEGDDNGDNNNRGNSGGAASMSHEMDQHFRIPMTGKCFTFLFHRIENCGRSDKGPDDG